MYACVFPFMFKVFSSFSQNYQSHMPPRSNTLRGRYTSEGEKHFLFGNIKAYMTKFCHHQKGGECNINPLFKAFKCFDDDKKINSK